MTFAELLEASLWTRNLPVKLEKLNAPTGESNNNIHTKNRRLCTSLDVISTGRLGTLLKAARTVSDGMSLQYL